LPVSSEWKGDLFRNVLFKFVKLVNNANYILNCLLFLLVGLFCPCDLDIEEVLCLFTDTPLALILEKNFNAGNYYNKPNMITSLFNSIEYA